MTTRLWHFTCDDAAPLIRAAGFLRPQKHPWLPEPLLWLTDLPDADAHTLGLASSGRLTCDRMAHRFTVDVDPGQAQWWPYYARRQVRDGLLPASVRRALDTSDGALPAHWWITLTAVPVPDRDTPAQQKATPHDRDPRPAVHHRTG